MSKIKCSYIACKHNGAVLTKNERGTWDCDVDLDYCNCEDEIELVSSECPECGNDDEQMTCKNFVHKPYLNQGREE